MINKQMESEEKELLKEYSPIEVKPLTMEQFKKQLSKLNISINLKTKLPKILETLVELFRNGVDMNYNISIISRTKDAKLITELITGYLSHQNVCANNLLIDYNYEKHITVEGKRYVSFVRATGFSFKEDGFKKIKDTPKNVVTVMFAIDYLFDTYKRHFLLSFPFSVIDKYTEKEEEILISKKIIDLGFTYPEKDFIKKGLQISKEFQTFDITLTTYLTYKRLYSKSREALINEFEAHIMYNDWEKTKEIEARNEKIDDKVPVRKDITMDDIIGQTKIKKELKRIVEYVKKNKDDNLTYHMAFLGNPGTGKTTIARLLAQELYDKKVLKENKFIEVSRGDLVAEYAGQSAVKTQRVIDSALGGVLFIDEAYSLSAFDSSQGYAAEVISTLVKAMEDKRNELFIIFAGYSKQTKRMIEVNPGLSSRIPFQIEFEDYSIEELMEIFEFFVNRSNYKVTDEVRDITKEFFKKEKDSTHEYFTNARLVRNFFERLKLVQTERSEGFDLTKEDALLALEELSQEKSKKYMGFVS